MWLPVLILSVICLIAACRKNVPETDDLMATSMPSPRSTSTPAPEWPRWRGPDGNNIFPGDNWSLEALEPEPDIIWQKNVGNGYATVSVTAHRLYAVGYKARRDTLFCLDAGTGAELWTFSYRSNPGYWRGPRSTPVVEGDNVYLISRHGLVFCLDRKTGELVWEKNLEEDYQVPIPFYGIACSPVFTRDMMLINVNQAGIALDKNNGTLIWKTAAAECAFASPVLYTLEKKQYAAMFGRTALYNVDIQTGEITWSYSWLTPNEINAADPLVVNNTIFISSNYKMGCTLLDISGIKPLRIWKNKNLMSHVSSFVYLDGYVYGNHGDINAHEGSFRCIELATGKLQWSQEESVGSLIYSNGFLFMLSETGNLIIARAMPDEYREITRQKILKPYCFNYPVLCNGRLYCKNDRGDIICINLQEQEPEIAPVEKQKIADQDDENI